MRLAGPLMLGQLGQVGMQLIDAAMIGRLGVVPLAAAAFANNILMFLLIVGYGLCMAVHIRVSRAHGAGHEREGVSLLKHGLWLAGVYGVVLSVGIVLVLDGFYFLGQPTRVVTAAEPYLVLVVWSCLPVLLFSCLKNYYEAKGMPWIAFFILLGGLLLNAGLNWILIYGNAGAPALGLEGAGWATLAARVVMLGCMFWLLVRRPEIAAAGAQRLRYWGELSLDMAKRMVSVGLPSALQLVAEIGLFSMVMLMAGWLGEVTLAAHHIAVNYAGFIFMIPLGMSFAITIRVGDALGRGDVAAASRISWSGVGTGVGLMAVCAGLTFFFRNSIPLVFVADPAVVKAAAAMLGVAVVFQMFDGAQVCCIGALRGMADVKIPTIMAFAGYWVVSLPVAYYCGIVWREDGVGLWFGLVTGLCAAALLLLGRLRLQTSRLMRNE